MLIALESHRAAFDLLGAEDAPVVCLTHSLAADSGMWAEQIPPLLAAGYRVLRIDMRGHGGSTPASGDATMDELADDVAQVVAALGIDDAFHYIGLSIGGMFGQAFAIHHGAHLKSLMLCDTLPASPENAKAMWGPRIETVRKAASLEPVAAATIERWLTAPFKQKHPGRWRQIYDTILGTTPEGFAGCAAAIQDFSYTDQLPTIAAPTMVVCGADDPGTPRAVNERIAGQIPGARFAAIPNAMHLPNIEDPDAFNRIMLGWLAANT
jgi:3-oxoadipate enol-lactonase